MLVDNNFYKLESICTASLNERQLTGMQMIDNGNSRVALKRVTHG